MKNNWPAIAGFAGALAAAVACRLVVGPVPWDWTLLAEDGSCVAVGIIVWRLAIRWQQRPTDDE